LRLNQTDRAFQRAQQIRNHEKRKKSREAQSKNEYGLQKTIKYQVQKPVD